MQKTVLLFIAAPSFFLYSTDAFYVSTLKTKQTKAAALHRHLFSDSFAGGDFDNGSDIEAARQKLESLVGRGDDGMLLEEQTQNQPTLSKPFYQEVYPSLADVILPEAPPLTAIDRERREAEIELLRQLEFGDDVLSDLWTLWYQERGAEAAAKLQRAEELSNHPKTWSESEILLQHLIDKYGVHWAEPVNRLATLYYMKGDLKKSEELCKTVLAVKPWHFGALSGIVMVYAAMHDVDRARHWAAHRLPIVSPSGSNRRRASWVSNAVKESSQSLLLGEKRLSELFGKKDSHVVHRKHNFEPDDGEGWQ